MNYFSQRDECYIIAEIGVNHNGDLSLAKDMIDAAKKSGADAVKFQTFKADRLVSKGTPKVDYQKSTTSASESHYEMIRKLELTEDNHIILKKYCENKKIDFLSTPYDVESASFLNEIGVKMFKTASADLIDLELHKFISKMKIPTIISVGMSTLGEIEDTISIYNKSRNDQIVLLHCISNYPCSDDSLNLNVMKTLRSAFQFPVGYSDHSIGTEAAILSISLGAKVIEKHFTLSKSLDGPDHKASSTPEEFTILTNSIRRAEKMLGGEIKICQNEEKQMAQVSRKSIVAKEDIIANTIINEKLFTLKRPGTGLKPSMLSKLVGLKIKNNLKEGELLKLSDLG